MSRQVAVPDSTGARRLLSIHRPAGIALPSRAMAAYGQVLKDAG